LEYYGLEHPLFEGLYTIKFLDTNINLSDNEIDTLYEWINQRPCELLYRATRDGWLPNHFHSKCDYKGTTLVIAETTCGRIIGGYTECIWGSNQGYIYGPSPTSSWIFSMRSLNGNLRLFSNNTLNHVYSSFDSGPTFGGGSDLRIYSDKQVSFRPYTYGLSNSISKENYLIGNQSATVVEVEVFRVKDTDGGGPCKSERT